MNRSTVAAGLVLAATLVAGCSALTGTLPGGEIMPLSGGDPVPLNPVEGDVVITGTVIDPAGRAVADAVVLVVMEPPMEITAELEVGDVLPQTELLGVTTGADGSFAIRLGRDPRILETAGRGGFVNLTLTAFERWPADDPGRMGVAALPITVTSQGYGGPPPRITIELIEG
jgi:hypothetical protein